MGALIDETASTATSPRLNVHSLPPARNMTVDASVHRDSEGRTVSNQVRRLRIEAGAAMLLGTIAN